METTTCDARAPSWEWQRRFRALAAAEMLLYSAALALMRTPRPWRLFTHQANASCFLYFLTKAFWLCDGRPDAAARLGDLFPLASAVCLTNLSIATAGYWIVVFDGRFYGPRDAFVALVDHGATNLLALVDFLCFSARLASRSLFYAAVLVYGVAYLILSATAGRVSGDGYFPYRFLDPAVASPAAQIGGVSALLAIGGALSLAFDALNRLVYPPEARRASSTLTQGWNADLH